MEHTIYLDFTEEDSPIDVYSVKMASESPDNPSTGYGVLDITANEIITSWGTTIEPYEEGKYSHTFTVENGHLYITSWEITANEGEDPTYKTDQVGPFFSVNDSAVRASASFGGKFIQGNRATVMLKITAFDGTPKDPEDIYITIYTEEGEIVSLDNITPEHVTTGYYVYDWNIPTDQTTGVYNIVWSYKVDDIEKAEVQEAIVSEDATDTALYSGRIVDLKFALEYHLTCAQTIPVYFEQSKISRDNKKYEFSFTNWNQSPGVKIYRNQEIINDDYDINYFKGNVIFDNALLDQDVINADYNFRWFSDDELIRFMANALQTVNMYPPVSNYGLSNFPDRFIPIVLYGAVKDALRHLMMCINFQQPAQVFGGVEEAQRAFANFESLKKNYEGDWEKLLEQKKYGPYPVSKLIVVPEYTLPGGRSRWFRYLFK